jgi:hypothetical protein
MGAVRSAEVLALLKANAIDQKLADARQLVAAVLEAPDRRSEPPTSWAFEATEMWTTHFFS